MLDDNHPTIYELTKFIVLVIYTPTMTWANCDRISPFVKVLKLFTIFVRGTADLSAPDYLYSKCMLYIANSAYYYALSGVWRLCPFIGTGWVFNPANPID